MLWVINCHDPITHKSTAKSSLCGELFVLVTMHIQPATDDEKKGTVCVEEGPRGVMLHRGPFTIAVRPKYGVHRSSSMLYLSLFVLYSSGCTGRSVVFFEDPAAPPRGTDLSCMLLLAL